MCRILLLQLSESLPFRDTMARPTSACCMLSICTHPDFVLGFTQCALMHRSAQESAIVTMVREPQLEIFPTARFEKGSLDISGMDVVSPVMLPRRGSLQYGAGSKVALRMRRSVNSSRKAQDDIQQVLWHAGTHPHMQGHTYALSLSKVQR